jgi:hypothetical protein
MLTQDGFTLDVRIFKVTLLLLAKILLLLRSDPEGVSRESDRRNSNASFLNWVPSEEIMTHRPW